MPNHWHFILWPTSDGDLPAFMQQLTNTHVKRWKEHRHAPRPRPPLPGPIQVLSRAGRRSLLRRGAIRRTQSAAGQSGECCRTMAVVELGADGATKTAIFDPRRLAPAAPNQLDRDRQSATIGSGARGIAKVRPPRPPVRRHNLDRCHGAFARDRVHASRTRTTETTLIEAVLH
jgi:hypothetical protein